MKTPITIVCLAMACFCIGVRVLCSRVDVAEGSLVTLEDRVRTLEATVEACCSTSTRSLGAESDLELMVQLRKKVNELERRIKELEGR